MALCCSSYGRYVKLLHVIAIEQKQEDLFDPDYTANGDCMVLEALSGYVISSFYLHIVSQLYFVTLKPWLSK